MTPIHLIIADDHPIVRDGIQLHLQALQNVKCLAAVGDGRALWEALEACGAEADVLILDLSMPHFEGAIQQVERIHSRFPGLKVLILSAHCDVEVISGLLEVGAAGYITKRSLVHSLEPVLTRVVQGQRWFSPDVRDLLLDQLMVMSRGLSLRQQYEQLTPREREIIAQVGRGENTQQIADLLGISPATVQAHLRNIYSKLGIGSRAEAAAFAQQCQEWLASTVLTS